MNPTQTAPASLPQNTGQLDPSVVNLMSGIRQVESQGNYAAKGKSGEIGAYQYEPNTFKAWAGTYLKNPNADINDPATQNQVAYARISDLKKQGYNPSQIASMWNSGRPDPTGNVGVNKFGAAFDTPKYVANVLSAAQQSAQKRRQSPGGSPIPTANAETGQSQSPQPQSPSVGGFIGNIGSSAENLAGGLGNAIMHPIQTAENVGGTIAGGAEKLFGVKNGDTDRFDNAVSYFKGRYGGDSISHVIGNIAHTAYTDPVGMALDLSTLLDGVGGAIGAVGKIADVSKAADLAKAADFISTASGLVKGGTPEATEALRTAGTASKIGSGLRTAADYTNPIGLAAKGVGGALSMGGRIGGEALGATTGAGYGAVKTAFNAAREGGDSLDALNAGMKGGEAGMEDLAGRAQDAYQDVADQTREEYQSKLSDIKAGEHTLTPGGMRPVYDKFDNLLNDFKVGRDEKGNLDFGDSPIDVEPSSQRLITQVDNELDKYQSGTKEINPENMDNLKKYIDDRYDGAGPKGRKVISTLKKSVRDMLNQNVPKYEEMTGDYHQALSDAKEMRDSLGTGSRQAKETVLRKITSAAKGNNKYRQALLEKLSQKSGTDLMSQSAGAALSAKLPQGLFKYAQELAGIGLNWHLLLALPFESPRLVGEFVKAIGKGSAKFEKIGDAFVKYGGKTAAKAGVEANRASKPK